MADIIRRLSITCAALLAAAVTTACDSPAQFAPSLPPAAGFRVDDGVLKLWTGTPCTGVTALTLTFDSGTQQAAEQVWTAPQPGVLVEHLDLLPTTSGSSFEVQKPLPAGYDWTTAGATSFAVDGPKSFGATIDIAQVVRESAQHPPESYLFGQRGWMNASDVQRENQKSFITICTPDPQ